MKQKIILTSLIILVLATLALYVSAQSQTEAPSVGMGRGTLIENGTGPYVVGNGVKAPVTFCIGPIMATDGTPKCLYNALPASGKLRIEMQDGTIQEIDLKNVKKMTVSDR